MIEPAHLHDAAEAQAEGVHNCQHVCKGLHVQEELLNERAQKQLMRSLSIPEVSRVGYLLHQVCALGLDHIHLHVDTVQLSSEHDKK